MFLSRSVDLAFRHMFRSLGRWTGLAQGCGGITPTQLQEIPAAPPRGGRPQATPLSSLFSSPWFLFLLLSVLFPRLGFCSPLISVCRATLGSHCARSCPTSLGFYGCSAQRHPNRASVSWFQVLRKRLSLARCPSWSRPLGLAARSPPPNMAISGVLRQRHLGHCVWVGRRHFQEQGVALTAPRGHIPVSPVR